MFSSHSPRPGNDVSLVVRRAYMAEYNSTLHGPNGHPEVDILGLYPMQFDV